MKNALDLQEVRRLAKSVGLQEAYFNEKSRVVSFAKPRETIDRIRFNVYYTTGTVGTCLNHPTQGRTQLFRRNVDLITLRKIFENPRMHTGVGYHRKPSGTSQGNRRFTIGDRAYVKGFTNCRVLSDPDPVHNTVTIEYDDGSIYHVDASQLEEVMEEVTDEETAAREQRTAIEDELKMLEKRMVKLREQLSESEAVISARAQERRQREEQTCLQKKREAEQKGKQLREEAERLKKEELLEQERLEQAKVWAARDSRGRNRQYCLCEADCVSKCFRDDVTCVSCGENATIMLYEGGGWSGTSGLPRQLYNKLIGRQKSLPKPNYVAIGSQQRYYVRFADGKAQYVGSEAMVKELQTTNRTVASVAFGAAWDSYFIVYTDGWWKCFDIPKGLCDLMDRRKNAADLKCVSLGPNGEYFLYPMKGRPWWGGLSQQAINEVNKVKNRISFMDFGARNSYFIRYR